MHSAPSGVGAGLIQLWGVDGMPVLGLGLAMRGELTGNTWDVTESLAGMEMDRDLDKGSLLDGC